MKPFIWIAVALMLTGATMLLLDVGASVLWIGAIALGIALVVIDGRRRHGTIGS